MRSICCCLLLFGCLPSLEAECSSNADCPADRSCIGGLCVRLPASDGDPPPEAGLDGEAPEAALSDVGPFDLGAPAPDLHFEVDPPDGRVPDCVPQPGDCNALDDDCDGTIDEASEAAEGCAARPQTVARCVAGPSCAYACAEGAVPVDDALESGCVAFAGCNPEPPEFRVLQRVRGVAADEVQQLALAVEGEARFVARYDPNATGQEQVLVIARFEGAEGELDTQRAGDVPGDFSGDYFGLDARPLGDGFTLSAWRRFGDDDTDEMPVLHVPAEGPVVMRSIEAVWPQAPSVVAGDAAGVVTVVETRDRSLDVPEGAVLFDVWDGLASVDVVVPAVEATHPVGSAQDIAWRLPAGGVALLSDTRIGDDLSTHALRFARFDRALAALDATPEFALAGRALDRITVSPPAPDGSQLALVLVDDATHGLAWFRVQADETLTPLPLGPPLAGPPRSARALDLAAGPAAVYRTGATVQLVVMSTGARVLHDAPLPGIGADVQQIDARPTADGFELVLMRARNGGMSSVEHARYTCR